MPATWAVVALQPTTPTAVKPQIIRMGVRSRQVNSGVNPINPMIERKAKSVDWAFVSGRDKRPVG